MTSATASSDDRAATLLRHVRALEIVARRNASGLLAGEYVTSTRGSGMIYRESRKYVAGDPVRSMDWLTTARAGEPYVKVHQEERQREIVLAVDTSPSMQVGFRGRSKIETAVELAATLAVSAVEAGDRLGWVFFADRVLDTGPPREGRRQLFRVLRSLLETAGRSWDRRVMESDPRTAIHAIQRQRGRRYVIFLISDFIDHDIPDDLRYLQARHDVSLLHVYDPVEFATSSEVLLSGRAAEGLRGHQRFRPGDTGSFEEMEDFLRQSCARHRMAATSCSTTEPIQAILARHFHRKRRLLL